MEPLLKGVLSMGSQVGVVATDRIFGSQQKVRFMGFLVAIHVAYATIGAKQGGGHSFFLWLTQ
jgi:hypothetical protein